MKKIIILLGLSSTLLNASDFPTEHMKKEAQKYLKSQGILYLGDGVHIKKRNEILLNEENKQTYLQKIKTLRSTGYVISDNILINEIKNIKNSIDQDFSTNTNNDPEDTHWKKSHKDIKLSWDFKPLKNIDVLAYAPSGGYNKSWSGMLLALKLDDNYCRYEIENLKASHGSINLPVEDIKMLVNNKPTMLWVEGNKDDGFLYQINWFENDFSYELQCVNSIYSGKQLQYFIEQANKIDKND